MPQEKNYKKALDSFFKYYQEQCERFISGRDGSFLGIYFSDWYYKKGTEILQGIKDNLSISRLDDRVAGFIDLYHFYIESAWDQNNEDLILENLFAVPGRMQCEFSEFGFLLTEALADEQDWLEGNYSIPIWDAVPAIESVGSYQYVMESDLSNRALLV